MACVCPPGTSYSTAVERFSACYPEYCVDGGRTYDMVMKVEKEMTCYKDPNNFSKFRCEQKAGCCA
ncbi:hypothetical protein M5X06_08925 [Paenibacillus alvei]|uniref:Uncharacterized protein n=1 Tax=Paenibacillus alvei TaxID=44250 RepID=A0ABT4H5R1_PAEAL|nr:hypothetical protein [Paenibacillus alvei]MCY9764327.1 hypothetical protein [Paenibacillus alvei]MCY9766955.1 hypothetical protein [Paenibacillus alvei]